MKSIERLLLWLVPVQLVGMILGLDSSIQLLHKSEHLFNSFGTPTTTAFDAQLAMMIPKILFFLIAHIIGAVWLYRREHNSPLVRWAWAIFGFTDGFWALAFFLFSRLLPAEISLQGDNVKVQAQDA